MMKEYVYLIRNGNLYNIGKTKQLDSIKKKLSPGVIEAVLKTEDALPILKTLQSKYSGKWLPESNYFRLTKDEFIECKRQLEKGQSLNDFKPFFSGLKLFFTFIFAWTGLSFLIIRFGIDPVFDKFN